MAGRRSALPWSGAAGEEPPVGEVAGGGVAFPNGRSIVRFGVWRGRGWWCTGEAFREGAERKKLPFESGILDGGMERRRSGRGVAVAVGAASWLTNVFVCLF